MKKIAPELEKFANKADAQLYHDILIAFLRGNALPEGSNIKCERRMRYDSLSSCDGHQDILTIYGHGFAITLSSDENSKEANLLISQVVDPVLIFQTTGDELRAIVNRKNLEDKWDSIVKDLKLADKNADTELIHKILFGFLNNDTGAQFGFTVECDRICPALPWYTLVSITRNYGSSLASTLLLRLNQKPISQFVLLH